MAARRRTARPVRSPAPGSALMFRLTRLAERCRGLGQVLRDPLRKPLSQMVREAADVARRTGAYPEWYFLSFVYRRDAGPYAEYLVRDQYQKLKVLEQGRAHDLLEDKLRFHERFRDTDCRSSPSSGPQRRQRLPRGRDGAACRRQRGFAELMDELRARSASGSIFVKPVDGRQGRHCRRIDAASTDLGELHAMTVAAAFPVRGDAGPARGAGCHLPSQRQHHPSRHLCGAGRAARRRSGRSSHEARVISRKGIPQLSFV